MSAVETSYGAIPKPGGLSLTIPGWIVSACVSFNFLLCFIHTNIAYVSPQVIILSEMLLVGMACLYGFQRIDRAKIFWIGVLVCQLVLFLILAGLKDEVPLKSARDLIIMPIFIILGLSAARMNFTRFVVGLTAVILAIGFWEAFDAERFLRLFNFKSFYLAKGTMTDTVPTAMDTFFSGVRPGGRFLLDMPGVHRISSLFLEPVSLGFYGFIVSLYAMAARENISRMVYVSILVMAIILIWLSDARMALGGVVLVFLLQPVFRRLDHRFAVLIFPAVAALSAMLLGMNALDVTGEGLGARLASTMNFIPELNFGTLSGVSGFGYFTADSAAGYLVHNLGILGLLLYWLPPFFFMRKVPPQMRVYIFGIAVYTGFAFMLSAAIFTIKTAALLWFGYGYIIARSQLLEDQEKQD